MSMFKKIQSSRGFTIVELLIVIIVIAILATLVITAYNGVQAKARDVKRQTDAQSVQKAAEAYAAENDGSYPTTTTQIEASTNTVQLDSGVKTNLDITAPSASAKDAIQLQTCDSGKGNAIVYWKEQGGGSLQTDYAGTHTSCAAAAS